MFKKYNTIENTYREEFLERIKGHGFGEDKFVVQEKVHGANLSYWTTDGIHFYSAKRTAALAEDEKFYNHEKVLATIKPNLASIWKHLQSEIPTLTQLTFFGEIMGGTYPHKEIQKNKEAIKVQKGIFYSPDNHFYAFDILINRERYVDVDEANRHFEREGLLYAKTLYAGSISECLAYPNDFDSKIPQELGLPALDHNTTEGVIIKPKRTRHFNSGSRVILKNKNEKWAENKKFHRNIRLEEEVSEKVGKLQEAILTYVTENRLSNVLSKIGEVSPKDFGRVLGMFNKDVVEDFLKDYGHLTTDLEKKEQKQINKSFNKEAVKLVKDALQNK